MLIRAPLAAVPACVAAWLLAASAIASPAPGLVELCTGTGIRLVAAPGTPKAPAQMPDCAKACHIGSTRRRLAG